MSGKPGRSGKRKGLKTLANLALGKVDQRLPEIFESLIELALSGDREALIYLIDRRLGKPVQQTDMNLAGGAELGAGFMTALLAKMSEYRQQMLTEPEPQIYIEGKKVENEAEVTLEE